MSKKQIENVAINALSNTTSADDWLGSLSWTFEGRRYHVWFTKHKGVTEPKLKGNTKYHGSYAYAALFCSPPVGIKSFDEGYFRTRKLDINGATAKWMIPQALAQFSGLWGYAVLALRAEQRVEDEKQAAAAKRNRMQSAAPFMYALLKRVAENLASDGVVALQQAAAALLRDIDKE